MQEDLSAALKDRSDMIQKGQKTGRIDYKLKGGLESMKQDLKHLEKLSYFYSNDDKKYKNIS